ncbi:glycine/betaine ABC transporter substrate-binding protein [Colwellia sp. 75C3]|uniref:ABC transporter substrate-binding protein n=1 Tax=Colwellia sp. 75C3 TaxID=888425 RepID=UPI000C330C3D|nr:ABC transporter substrate-binding protein [Colwellia sp. 75C3]PKG81068.1 glycine/betaine ABC transporter substrate-binding protein [Colwellia sp. 75C3]
MRVSLLFLLILVSLRAMAVEEQAIVLPLNDWPSQRLLSKIVGAKIEQLGYLVEYLPLSSINQLGAMRKGFVHIQVEIWQTYDDGDFIKAVNKGYIEDLGLHSAFGREDWWYPEYVEELCPDLPSWQALKKCTAIFSDGNHGSKGVYYTGPWNYRDAAMIRSLGMDFAIERLDDAEQLWQKLSQAEKNKQPIVLLHWSPNWVDVRIKGNFVEFPDYDKACEQDPAWGVNKEMLYDCGNPKVTLIKKAAWPGVKHKWPCVYQLMTEVNFTTEMISYASYLYSVEQKTAQPAIDKWLAKYGEQSKAWLNFTCPI